MAGNNRQVKHARVTCVFVHGWAMNSAVWEECISALPGWIDAIVVDLPGHGTMAEAVSESIDDYVETLVPLVHQPVIWVGWSLGGLAVLRLAELYPQRIAAALLVATNPCFVRQPGWSCGVDREVFDQFARNLNQYQQKTIRRFLALQVKGLPDAIRVARKLQESIESRGAASTEALVNGLKILLETDLRQNIRLIECPLHWSLGAKDSLVPSELSQVLENDFAQDDVELNPRASHAPFLSHQNDFVRHLLAIAETQRDV